VFLLNFKRDVGWNSLHNTSIAGHRVGPGFAIADECPESRLLSTGRWWTARRKFAHQVDIFPFVVFSTAG
jgi:hypothetical protein